MCPPPFPLASGPQQVEAAILRPHAAFAQAQSSYIPSFPSYTPMLTGSPMSFSMVPTGMPFAHSHQASAPMHHAYPSTATFMPSTTHPIHTMPFLPYSSSWIPY
jgi:hypothetical protein